MGPVGPISFIGWWGRGLRELGGGGRTRERETGLSLFSLDEGPASIGATRSHKCGTPSGGGGGIVGWRFDRLTDQRQCGGEEVKWVVVGDGAFARVLCVGGYCCAQGWAHSGSAWAGAKAGAYASAGRFGVLAGGCSEVKMSKSESGPDWGWADWRNGSAKPACASGYSSFS